MTPSSGLLRGLGLWTAMSINIANMIGTGVFLKARVMTCNVGSPIAVLGVWLAAGLLVLAGALTYAELAAMMPKAGGEYVFIREAYGRRWGFLWGWMYLLVSRGGSLAAQSVSTAIFFNIVTGGALGERWLALGALTALALTAAVNCAAVAATGRIAAVLTAIKIAVVLAVGVSAFFLARGDWAHFAMSGVSAACADVSASARGGITGFGAAMLGALWGFQGWATLAPLSGEVRDPGRNIPRAFFGAMLIVGVLYLFANASYFFALSPAEVASVSTASSVATEVLRRVFGPLTAALMAMAMMISSLGALHTGIAATARVPYAMAGDGLFFRYFARLSGSHVPVRGVVIVAIWSGVLALTGSYDRLTDWAIFCLWLFYGLTAGSVLIFRRRMPEAERPYRVPLAVPIVFLSVTILLLVNTVWTTPLSTLASLGLLTIGFGVYRWLLRSARQ